MTSVKKFHFQGSYLPQNWSSPDSLIYYILKNPSTSKVYEKLVQTCKYFFAKNPILTIEKLHFSCDGKGASFLYTGEQLTIDFTKETNKFWITDRLNIFGTHGSPNAILSILPHIYCCNAKILYICDQVFSYKHFLFLSSNAEDITLDEIFVENEDGTNVSLEKLIKILPKLKEIDFTDNLSYSSITKNTVNELLEIPHFPNINELRLFGIPETFNIEMFYTMYIKKNKHTKFRVLIFNDSISQAYRNRVEAIIDEIIQTKDHEYYVPYISFNGLDGSKDNAIYYLHVGQ